MVGEIALINMAMVAFGFVNGIHRQPTANQRVQVRHDGGHRSDRHLPGRHLTGPAAWLNLTRVGRVTSCAPPLSNAIQLTVPPYLPVGSRRRSHPPRAACTRPATQPTTSRRYNRVLFTCFALVAHGGFPKSLRDNEPRPIQKSNHSAREILGGD
jgi:hypothetical protein